MKLTTTRMILAILTTTTVLTIMTSSIGAGEAFAAKPDCLNPTICHGANEVASVSQNGLNSVQGVMAECKATTGNTAKECATGTTPVPGTPGPGQFASTLAHGINGP